MTTELTLLIWSTVLVGAYIGVQSILYRMDVGVEFAASARDEERPLGTMTRRAEKALGNLLETYIVFVALAAATQLSGRSDWLTVWGAWIWFGARWVYLPLYLGGVFMVRSLVWLVSAIGLAMMFFGVAF
jgi:uncharacterized MAPEG superfamily protein